MRAIEDDPSIYHPSGRVQVHNVGSNDIPAYGIVYMTDAGSDYIEGKTYLKVDRPDGTYRQTYLVCGPRAIKAGKKGTCYFGINHPVWALWDSGSSDPAIGDFFIPIPDSFKLTAKGYGFRVVGKSETTPARRVLVLQEPPQSIVVTLDGDLESDSTATASVRLFAGGGSYPDSSFNVTAYGDFVPSGKKLAASSSNPVKLSLLGGKWVADTSKVCPVTA